MNKKIEKYVYNWQAYNALNSLPSDHRVVTMKMKLSFPKHKTESRGSNYDWAILENKEIKDIYYVEFKTSYKICGMIMKPSPKYMKN